MSNSSVAESVESEPCGVFLLHHLVPGPVLLPAGNNTVPLEGDTGPWPPEHSKVPLPVRRWSHRELKGSCQQGSSVSVHSYKLATIGLDSKSPHKETAQLLGNSFIVVTSFSSLVLVTFPHHLFSSPVFCFLVLASSTPSPLVFAAKAFNPAVAIISPCSRAF